MKEVPQDWLAARSALTPGAPALQWGDRVVSYLSLNERAERLAGAFEQMGMGPGEVVAGLFQNGLELPVLFWALQKRGAVFLPLNWRLTPSELAHPIADAGARWVLHADDALAESARRATQEMGGRGLGAVSSEGQLTLEPMAEGSPWPPASDLLRGAMALLYTSGTSGQPKGAVLGPEAFEASAKGAAALLGASAGDRWLACMPLFHVGGLSILTRSCLYGGTAILHPGFDAAEVLYELERSHVTHISLVASMLDRILRLDESARAPASLRCALLGGGPTPAHLVDEAVERGWPIASTYGLTEATSQVATRPPAEVVSRPEEGLVPLPGNRIRILNPEGLDAPVGEAGEIWIAGPTLMRGYLGSTGRSSAPWFEAGFRTGDMGRLDEQGNLCVLDRRDDLIVSGGENVYPAEVEAVLLRHPAVAEVGVTGIPDSEFGARPVAHWVAAESDAEASDLAAYCRAELAGFKVPVAFYRCEALPRSASGKLLRRVLSERCAEPKGRAES
ncbi:MAG: o-succinylbenzoate--CoA ligase [bacterium TMED88]|nr:o-succinylbenzoate--CoA ligase [Deltaproteobacteria bacterium]OUV32317.1 MAG: o-succinylbenzoate--CoA ligase [bacterium TMED88]